MEERRYHAPSLSPPLVEQEAPPTPQAPGTGPTESTSMPADPLSPHKLALGQVPETHPVSQMPPLDQFPVPIPVLSLSLAPRQLPPDLPTIEPDCPILLPNRYSHQNHHPTIQTPRTHPPPWPNKTHGLQRRHRPPWITTKPHPPPWPNQHTEQRRINSLMSSAPCTCSSLEPIISRNHPQSIIDHHNTKQWLKLRSQVTMDK